MKKALRIAAITLAAIATVIGLVFAGLVLLVSLPIQFVRDLFRPGSKSPKAVPLETQFATLAACGIEIDRSLLQQVPIQHALKRDYWDSLEKEPYIRLLHGAGTAVTDPDTQQDCAPCPRVFRLPDSIDEAASYGHMLQSCAGVAGVSIESLSVQPKRRVEDEVAVLSFQYAGRKHQWQMSCASEHIDDRFFDLVPSLQLGGAEKRLYWVGDPGECVIGLKETEAEQLRARTGLALPAWTAGAGNAR